MSSWRSPPPNVILENVCENFGQRACLFGDCVVSPVTNLSTCVCRPGFSHDVLWQRLENCASPGEYWSLVVHLVNIACGVVALALMCAYYRNLRGGAFRSVFFLGVTVTALILASITFLSQGFGGRAYYFFNAVALSGFALCLAFFSDTLWGITQKAMKMSGNAKRNDRLMTIIRYCFFLSFLWLGVPFWPGFFYMLSLGDETDPNYDIVAANMAWTLPYPLLELHNFVFFPAFVTMSRYLISVIDESIERKRSGNNNALEASSTVVIIVRLQETRRRISLFTMLAAGVAAPMEFLLFVVLLPAIYFLKVPGMWLILGLEYAFVNCVVALILATLRTRTSRIKKMMEAELVARWVVFPLSFFLRGPGWGFASRE